MERIKTGFIIVITCIITFLTNCAFAEESTLSALITPQNVEFEKCTKQYNLPPEKLYYLTAGAINANRFEIDELQSKTGYILFRAVGKEFLASVVKLSTQKSMLKITPTDGNYYFAPGIVSNTFKYIDLNLAAPLTQVKPTSN